MPGLHPGPGERRVVDQADVGEAAEYGLGGPGRYPAAAQRLGQLGPGPGRGRQQPQADLPGLRFRVTDLVLSDVARDPEACLLRAITG